MSDTFPIQASALRQGGYIVIKGRPCKIIGMTTSKTGKHGHAKVHFTGTDIFTGSKMELLEASTHNVDSPHVNREEFTLVNIDDNYMSLMNNAGEMKEDVRLPEGDLGEEIQAAFDEGKEIQVSIQSSMGQEAAIAYKASKAN